MQFKTLRGLDYLGPLMGLSKKRLNFDSGMYFLNSNFPGKAMKPNRIKATNGLKIRAKIHVM